MTPMPQPPDEFTERWLHNTALSVCRSWPDVLLEDVKQELHAKWLEKYSFIRRYLDDPDEARGKAFILRALKGWGNEYARRETAAIRQCSPDDLNPYSKGSIRMMLPLLRDPEAWSSFAAKGGEGGPSGAPVNEGGTVMAVYADLTRAWGKLTTEQAVLLNMRYVADDDTCYPTIAAMFGITEDAARKRVERALSKLQQLMQGESRYEAEGARRRAQSNASAQAVTRRAWVGE
jgi:DNA-directed RNA polymerase specialized sigma24 family protein